MLRINQAVITGGSFTQVNATSRDGFQILQDSVADGAFHNSKERFDPPKCHEKTRISVLQRILDWVFRQDENTCDAFIMWLYGLAGAGKSAIMQTIAEKLDASHHLVASFFFSRNHPTRGNADRLIATIAYQLALVLPVEFRQSLVIAVEHDPLIFSKTLEVQFTELISRPMEQLFMSEFSTNHTYLVIIDGLDECNNPQIQSKIIDLAFKVHHTSQHLPLLFLIASRSELEIFSSFESRHSASTLSRLALDDTYLPNDDVREYIMAEFEEIKKTHRFRSSIPVDWPSEEAVETLVSKSSGQFIYAATVVKYVASIRRRPTECLDKILGLRPIGKDTPFAELDSLYRHILSKVDDLETVLMVIGVVSLKPPFQYFLDRLTNFHATRHIESLLFLEPGSLNILFQDLSSLFSVIAPFEEGLHISHASLSDFLFDSSRSQDLWVSPRNVHTACVNQCLIILNDIATPGLVVVEMLHRLCYHFPLADPDSVIVENVLDFTFQKFLSRTHELRSARYFPGQGPFKYATLSGYYICWAESMTRWDNREVEQFRIDQLDAFDLYLTSHLDVYFSNPDLLWALAITTGYRHTYLYPSTKISQQLDHGGLMLYHLSGGKLSPIGTTRYLDAISVFLSDTGRAGKYFMTGATYAGVAFYVLRCLCSRRSCPLPRSLSELCMHKRRNFPTTWHRQQARRGLIWRRYSYIHHVGVEKDGEVLEPSKFFAQRRFPDMVDWKVYLFEEERDIRAHSVFQSALSSLPYLLEKSERSEELINLARTAIFGTMAKNLRFSKEVRLAKKAIKKYLTRMEGQSESR